MLAHLFLLLGGLLLLPRPAGAGPLPRPLPPPPDSLRAALRAAPSPAARAQVWLRVGHAFAVASDSAALAYARAVLRQARQTADPHLRGQGLDLLGSYYLLAHDEQKALRPLEEAARLLASAPLPERVSNFVQLGDVYDLLERPALALRSYRRAEALFGQNGNAFAQAQVINAIGSYYVMHDQADSASVYLFRALRQFQRLHHPTETSAALLNISALYYNQNRPADAATYARRAYAIQATLGDSATLMQTLNYLGSIAYSRDSLPAALGYFRASQRLMRAQPGRYGFAPMYFSNLAAVFRRLHQPDSAEAYYRRSLHETQRLGKEDAREAGQTMAMMAEFYRSINRFPEAVAFAEKARAIGVRNHTWVDAQWAVQILRNVAVQQHDYLRAYTLAREERQLDSSQQASTNQHVTEGLRVRYETEQAEQQARIGRLQAAQQAGRARLYALVAGGLLLLLMGGGALMGLLVRSRRRLQTSETALRQAHDTQQELMRIIGHDLRGPVSTFQQITPLLHEILGPTPPADASEIVRELDASAQRLGALVDNLLHWARMQGGLVQYAPVRQRLAPAVRSVEQLYAPVAQQKGVTLVTDVPADLVLTTDLDLLTTVLRNLLANALKFTPPGGTVRLSVEPIAETSGAVRFAVTDTGVGMPPAALAAFRAAARLPSQPGTAGEPGTGLGLPVCQRFVALLGGELCAEPNQVPHQTPPLGPGMRFWFQLS